MSVSYRPFDWYQAPLYYDIVFDADTKPEGRFLEQALDRYGRTGGRSVLEPACGTGRLVAEMTRRGFAVHGYDLSEGALRFARRRLRGRKLTATLTQASMADFTCPRRFDLAHCLVSSFKYLTDEADARSHLRSIADHLVPGGLYVLGLHLSEFDHRSCLRERWVARRRTTEVTCNIQTWPVDVHRRTQRLRSRLIVRRPAGESRYETNWTFRAYTPQSLRRLLATEPRLEHVATHDFDVDLRRPVDLEGDRLDVVLVLRRTGRA